MFLPVTEFNERPRPPCRQAAVVGSESPVDTAVSPGVVGRHVLWRALASVGHLSVVPARIGNPCWAALPTVARRR